MNKTYFLLPWEQSTVLHGLFVFNVPLYLHVVLTAIFYRCFGFGDILVGVA